MRVAFLLLAAVVAAGCGKGADDWEEHRSSTLEVPGFVVPIPAGWRDMAERKRGPKAFRDPMPKGSRAILPEDLASGRPAAIFFIPLADDGAGLDCALISKLFADADHLTATDIKSVELDHSLACRWTEISGTLTLNYLYRANGPNGLALGSISAVLLRPRVATVFEQVISTVHVSNP